MREQVYVAWVDCSPNVEQKINSKHGVTVDEVRKQSSTRVVCAGQSGTTTRSEGGG